MKKTLKFFIVLLMTMVMFATCTPSVFATDPVPPKDTDELISSFKPNTADALKETTGIIDMVNRVLGVIQIASVILAVVLIAVFGFKFILGSANEKADYQKAFIPLIVGLVVVFAATSIAKLILGIMG